MAPPTMSYSSVVKHFKFSIYFTLNLLYSIFLQKIIGFKSLKIFNQPEAMEKKNDGVRTGGKDS